MTKVLLWFYFVYAYLKTKRQIEKRSHAYFHYLFLLSTCYMLAVPVSILITFVFEPYERQQVFDVVSHTLMFATNVFLLY